MGETGLSKNKNEIVKMVPLYQESGFLWHINHLWSHLQCVLSCTVLHDNHEYPQGGIQFSIKMSHESPSDSGEPLHWCQGVD